MARPTKEVSYALWSDTADGKLHRAGERLATAIGRQFHGAGLSRAAAGFAESLAADAPSKIDEHVLNTRPDPVDFRDMPYRPGLIELMPRLLPPDLDALGLAVRDQGNEGSCTGQALAAVIDLQNVKYAQAAAAVPRRVSARMLYESARAFDEYPDDGLPGSSARGALKGFFHRGVCGTDLAPYFPGDLGWRLDVERAKAARQVTLGAYFRLRHVLNDYHAALCEVNALFCTAMVHDGWMRDAVHEAKGEIRTRGGIDARRVELTGAHAFAIVGYTHEGFIILNSWGAGWGGYAAPLSAAGKTGGERDRARPGMALWPYDQWCEHVLDTWALRLQVPAALPSGYSGGYHVVRRPGAGEEDPVRTPATPSSVPTSDVAGHIVNVADGIFVKSAPYENDKRTFEETARFLLANEAEQDELKRYKHVLFYAHGGLNEVEGAASRAAAMTPIFKYHGIYPVFFLWHTGLGETAEDLMRRLFEGAAERAGGFTDFSDTLLENAVRPFGGPLWREMKADAERCFANLPDGAGGDAWRATRLIADAALMRQVHPMQVHLVGHSAGAILLGEMLKRARAEARPLASSVSTISLLAPACTRAFFGETLADVQPDRTVIYNLTDATEKDDSVAGLYRKSLLYLVSNAFEEKRATPLLGMDVFRKPDWPVQYKYSGVNPPENIAKTIGQTTTHGGFDNDPDILNDILARVLGRPSITEKEGGFSLADLVGRGF